LLIDIKWQLGATPDIPKELFCTAPKIPATAVAWSPLTILGDVPVSVE